MNNLTVKSLRQQGYKVRVLHHRDYAYVHPPEKFDRVKRLMQKGGKTEVQILSPDGKSSEGIALCSPKDNYNKKLGVKIALNRAINNLNEKNTISKNSNRSKDVIITINLNEVLEDLDNSVDPFFKEEFMKLIKGHSGSLLKR